ALTQTIDKAATTTTVTSSANPALAGQPVALTATVSVAVASAMTPTGTVTFLDGSLVLGTSTLNASRQATVTTSALSVGAHSIAARYAGNTTFAASASATVTVSVNRAATKTSVSASRNPSVEGQGVPLAATVTVVAPGTAI